MEANKILIDLTRPSSGGSGGSSDYSDLTNKPKINNNTLSGNKTPAQLGLVGDVQVNGTSVTTDGVANIPVAAQDTLGVSKVSPTYGLTVSNGIIVGSTKTESVYSTAANSLAICKGTLENIKDTYVRSVQPAYTLIEATTSTYNLVINNCYGQIPSQAVTYTLPAVTAGVDNWVKIFVDTTTTASIAIASADSKTINPNGTADIQTGHKYIIICQFNNLKDEWEIYIIDGGSV